MDKTARIARRQALARRRAAMSRENDRSEAVPDSRALDRAIADGVATWLVDRFGGEKSEIARSADACAILQAAIEVLVAARYDMKHPVAKARWRARLRLGGAIRAARQTI